MCPIEIETNKTGHFEHVQIFVIVCCVLGAFLILKMHTSFSLIAALIGLFLATVTLLCWLLAIGGSYVTGAGTGLEATTCSDERHVSRKGVSGLLKFCAFLAALLKLPIVAMAFYLLSCHGESYLWSGVLGYMLIIPMSFFFPKILCPHVAQHP